MVLEEVLEIPFRRCLSFWGMPINIQHIYGERDRRLETVLFEQEACIQVAGVAMIFADPSLPRPRYNGPTENTLITQSSSAVIVSLISWSHTCLKRSHEMRYPLLNIVIVRHDLARGQGNANAVSRWWHLVRTICHRPKDPRPWPSTKSRLTPWLDWCCVCALCPVHCALCPAWLEPVPSPLPGKGECDCECDCERQRERAFLMAVFCKHRKASKQAFAAVLGLLGSIPS